MAASQAPRPWDSPGKNTGVGCHRLLCALKLYFKDHMLQTWDTLLPYSYQIQQHKGCPYFIMCLKGYFILAL